MAKRKLSEEQREANIARLKAATERRIAAAGKPANVAQVVYDLDDDHYLSYKKVKAWIKSNKDQLPTLRRAVRQNIKGSNAELASVSAYIRHLEWYLRTGDYIDNFYGENQEHKITWKTTREAYDEDGCVKQ